MVQRRTRVLLCLCVAFAFAAVAVAKSDIDEISAVLETAYFEGLHVKRDGGAMRSGFHEAFHLYVLRDGGLSVVTLEDWIDKIEAWREAEPDLGNEIEWRLAHVDVTGDAAIAQVEILRDGQLTFTDYFSLYRMASGWQIVTKVFHDHRRSSAGS